MAQYDTPTLQENASALYVMTNIPATAGGVWGFNPTTRLPEVVTTFTYDTSGNLVIADGKNVTFNTTTGTKLGTSTTQKFSFWNSTPVVQPTAVADAAGGATVDAEGRTALNSLLARLRTIGIIAT